MSSGRPQPAMHHGQSTADGLRAYAERAAASQHLLPQNDGRHAHEEAPVVVVAGCAVAAAPTAVARC